MTVAAADVAYFGNMVITSQCSGYGISGCLSTSFDVDVYDTVGTVKNTSKCAAVQLTGSGFTIPAFYISTREINGDVVRLHCLDRMMFVDQMCDISDFGTSTTISTSTVVASIASQCGFSSWGVSAAGFSALAVLRKDDVYMQSCRDILDKIATACAGVWICTPAGVLTLVGFGGSYYGANLTAHTAVTGGGSRTFTGVEMTDGTDTYSSGSTSGKVLRISTPYASSDLAGLVYNGTVANYSYDEWACDKGLCGAYVGVPSTITFTDNVTRGCNSVTLYPSSAGMYISCGHNRISESEWDYDGLLDRQIKNKIGVGDVVGGVALSKADSIVVFKNLN